MERGLSAPGHFPLVGQGRSFVCRGSEEKHPMGHLLWGWILHWQFGGAKTMTLINFPRVEGQVPDMELDQ